jgi:hypothetical protein
MIFCVVKIYYVLLFKNFIILSYINETLFAFNIHNVFLASNSFPIISPNPQKCGNGISCTNSQTCMSNTTGARLVYTCSHIPSADRCMDTRFSCQTNSNCILPSGKITDAVINLDAFEVMELP